MRLYNKPISLHRANEPFSGQCLLNMWHFNNLSLFDAGNSSCENHPSFKCTVLIISYPSSAWMMSPRSLQKGIQFQVSMQCDDPKWVANKMSKPPHSTWFIEGRKSMATAVYRLVTLHLDNTFRRTVWRVTIKLYPASKVGGEFGT